MFQPLEINEETLAYSAHQEVGQGGHFLGAVHTLERFRECFYRPLVSSTENYERWDRNGGHDTAARANEIWKKTLEEYEEPAMDDGPQGGTEGVRRSETNRARRLSMATVGEVMSQNLLTVEPTTPLRRRRSG